MSITETLYMHLYPLALKEIIHSLDTQVSDYDENKELYDNDEVEDIEYMRSELRKVLQIYVNYNSFDEQMEELALEYGITKNN